LLLEYVEAVRAAIRAENWYVALPMAPTLPDVCGWLEDPLWWIDPTVTTSFLDESA